MLKHTLACLLSLFVISTSALAGGALAPADASGTREGSCDCGAGLRLSVMLGGAWERYTGETKLTADAGNAITDRHHVDLDLDLALYFRPTSDSVLFGVTLDVLSDSWWKDPAFARVTQFLLGIRTTYFFSHELARGPYAHGDLGAVMFSNDVGNSTGRTIQSTMTSSPLGFGARLGAGYAFKVSQSVSLLAEASWSFRTAGAATAMPVVLSGGLLF